MTRHETAIAERLRDAADRIPVETDPGLLLDRGTTTAADPPAPVATRPPASATTTTAVVRRPPVRRRTVLAGLAVAASAAAVVAAVGLVRDAGGDPADRAGTDAAGPAGDGQAPTPAPVPAPRVASPPEWFDGPQGVTGTRGERSGRWTSMAIGRESAEGVSDAVVVSAFAGDFVPLIAAEAVTIGGVPLRALRHDGGWWALATIETPGMPTVMVSGSVREGTLVGLLDAVVATDPGTGGPDLRLRSLPDGYTVIAAPRELGPDAEERRTLASASGDTGINEVSDWTDPLLYAAGSGSDLTPAEIGDGDGDGGDAGPTTGWTGSTVANRDSPVLFLAWSPHPGVVFEITTTDPRRTAADLADLAGATTTVDPDEWDRLHGDR